MGFDALAHAAELAEARQPFVLATVVWRRGPSSGRVGAKALILADGTVRGWLGGACAEPSVLAEARAVLAGGVPRLMLLGPSPVDELLADDRVDDDHVTSLPMACDNDGALEIFLEPIMPTTQLVVVGRSPAVHALTEMALALDWAVVVVDDGGRADEHPHPELVRTKLDLAGVVVDSATAVVVATQGHYDDVALAAALDTPAGYVGLVAAPKRAETVLGYLRDRGLSDEALARVHAPAGLDLGHLANRDIAVSIVADLVARRARGELQAVPDAVGTEPPVEAIDPVCGMTVLVADAKYQSRHDGVDYFFCAAGCQKAFEGDPAGFAIR